MYIGITCQDVKNRWQNGKTYRESTYFRRAIRKYGWKNIKHEILFTDLPKQRAIDLEISLIKHQALNGRRGGLYKGYIWKYEEKQ